MEIKGKVVCLQGTFVSGVHVGYINTDTTGQLTVRKAPTSVITRCILDGLKTKSLKSLSTKFRPRLSRV